MLKKDVPWKCSVGVSRICGHKQKIYLTLRFEVGASNERSCLWQLVNVACADYSRLNTVAQGEHLSSQLSWLTACRLATRVYLVHLSDELFLVFYTPLYDWANGGSVDVFEGMVSVVLVLWELMLFWGMVEALKGENMSNCFREVK